MTNRSVFNFKLQMFAQCVWFHGHIVLEVTLKPNIPKLEVVPLAGDAVIRLKSYDTNGDQLIYKITSLPSSGSLYQLSQVYNTKGYEPKAGTPILESGVAITGTNNRIYYKRPSPDSSSIDKWTSFNFTVGNGKKTSLQGTITIVSPAGALVGSDFLLNNEGWNIIGNKATTHGAVYEPYSRGPQLNRYIYGMDDKINVMKAGSSSPDQSLWYFSAPSDYLGNQGISYGGTLQFTLAGFSGDFSKNNGVDTHVIRLECASCVGPVGKGIVLAIPLKSVTPFTGSSTMFKISLHESGGWLKDPQNTLLNWIVPSKCDMIQVLSRLSAIRILGDWTPWYETVAMDNDNYPCVQWLDLMLAYVLVLEVVTCHIWHILIALCSFFAPALFCIRPAADGYYFRL
eukprot:gene915-1777_t